MTQKAWEVVVCIGSTNPVKIRGVVDAFSKFYVVKKAKYVKVNTDVPPQPIGLDQIIKGARQRAIKCMNQECDFGVGVEAGFYLIENEPYDVEVAYIISRDGKNSMGLSPSFPIPRGIYDSILNGEYRELDEAIEKIFNIGNIGEKEGFIGLLTKRMCERYTLSYYATLMALVKFLNENLYFASQK
ncbi:MAG: inosine/xanthosine triphosphatase [Desulfurococcaceae archaeon]